MLFLHFAKADLLQFCLLWEFRQELIKAVLRSSLDLLFPRRLVAKSFPYVLTIGGSSLIFSPWEIEARASTLQKFHILTTCDNRMMAGGLRLSNCFNFTLGYLKDMCLDIQKNLISCA